MTYVMFLLAFAGVVAHLLMAYWNAYTVKETFDWKGNLLVTAISLIVVAVLIIAWDKVSALVSSFGLPEELNEWTSFLMGYFADSFIKNVLPNFNPYQRKP